MVGESTEKLSKRRHSKKYCFEKRSASKVITLTQRQSEVRTSIKECTTILKETKASMVQDFRLRFT